MWIVYEAPRDFPNSFVLRGWTIAQGQLTPDLVPSALVSKYNRTEALEAIRNEIPAGTVRLERHPLDDPAILEIWV